MLARPTDQGHLLLIVPKRSRLHTSQKSGATRSSWPELRLCLVGVGEPRLSKNFKISGFERGAWRGTVGHDFFSLLFSETYEVLIFWDGSAVGNPCTPLLCGAS